MGKGLVFSWPGVWESNVIGPLLGLSEYNIFWVGGRGGGCARRCGGERGKGRDHCQLSNLVRPRGFIVHPSKPPSPRHSQHNLSNLPCCCSPSPVPSPSRPPPPNPPGRPPKSDFQKSLLSSANPPNLPTPAQATIDGTPTNPTRTNLPPWPQTITGSIPTWPLWTSSQRPSPTHHPGHLGPDNLAACAAGLLLPCTGAPTSSTATIQSTPRHDQKSILPTRRSLFSISKAFFFLFEIYEILSLF